MTNTNTTTSTTTKARAIALTHARDVFYRLTMHPARSNAKFSTWEDQEYENYSNQMHPELVASIVIATIGSVYATAGLQPTAADIRYILGTIVAGHGNARGDEKYSGLRRVYESL
jgi:hypothetical protein